jgi:hypothetical protein
MSQRTKSHPGASRAGDSVNHLTEGSRIRGPVNAQPRGFITPTMSARRDSQVRPTTSIVGAPESASSQLRGLIVSVPGVHRWRTSPSTRCRPSTSVRTISRCCVSCPAPARAVDRPTKGSTRVLVVVDCDIRPGHSTDEPMTSPVPASDRGSTVASSLRCQVERERRTASPEGSRWNDPSLQLHSFTGLQKSGSKMVKQVPCLSWRCWWPRWGPVPEVPSGSLRWAS